MRRRTIIAIIITIIVLFCSYTEWLIFKPMTVDFDINGKGICKIEVQFNKKNNEEFVQIVSETKEVNLDEEKHVHFDIKNVSFPKKIRFVFSDIKNGNPIEIKNIALKRGKYKLDDLNSFTSDSGELVISENTIQITPPPQYISFASVPFWLTYNKKLDLRSSCNFDVRIFIIILVLTYFLAYKLTNYVADFNTVKHQSKIEVIFLAVFFIFLFIPMININQDNIARKENRTLSKYKPLFNKMGINYNFGKDYNKWFNDRFNLRLFLLDVYSYIQLNLTGKSKNVTVDKNGFAYISFEYNHSFINAIDNKDYDALVQFDKYCKAHNIELYIMIVPPKECFYPLTKQIFINDNYAQIIDNKIKALNEKYNMHIVHPLEAMKKEAESNYVYFKTEHHWTDDGAFVAYKELMKEIRKKHKDIPILKQEDFTISYNNLVKAGWFQEYNWGTSTLNMPKPFVRKLHNINYRYYKYKDYNLLQKKTVDIPNHLSKYFYYPKGVDYRVILLGSSVNENLCQFIPFTFKNVFRLRNITVRNHPVKEEFKIMKYHEKEMLDYKPDIIIFGISYWNMLCLNDIFVMN